MTFEEVYQQYSKKVFRICMGFVNDHDRAKDLTQETFIAVWQNLENVRNEAHIGTWIFRIATNHCLRLIERDKKTIRTKLPKNLPETEQDCHEARYQLLQKCIGELEETERIIISLVLEDVPQVDIANIVGVSDNNIRVKIFRIREKLTKKIREYGGFN